MEEDDKHSSSSSGTSKVETSRAEKAVWLMKCPLVIARSWKSHTPSDPTPVGKVIVSLDPLKPADDTTSLEFALEIAAPEAGNAGNPPKCYELKMSKDVIPLCVFSETPQGKLAVEGKVDHKFDMKPKTTSLVEYGRLCRERTNKSMVKNRQIQVLDNDRGVHMRPMPGLGIISAINKDKKKLQPVKQSDLKRTRRDRGELEDIMFKLFEKQPNWTLRHLVEETDQPAQFVKEILSGPNGLCVYNKRGANQGTYELKPEYKKSVAEETAGAE